MLTLGSIRKLHGVNSYSHRSVLLGAVECIPPAPDGSTPDIDPGSSKRCARFLRDAGLAELPNRFSGGLPAETAVQTVAMALMSWAGVPDIDLSEWMDGHPGRFAILGEPEPLARECADAAISILSLFLGPAGTDGNGLIRDRIAELDRLARKQLLPIQSGALADACRRRGIGWRRISAKPDIFQFGEGARQCRLDLSVSSGTGRLATEIASDKYLASSMLARFGLPVSQQIMVRDADAAWQAATRMGLPVVVKPRRGNMGKGVSVRLTSEEEVRAAVQRARRVSRDVIVETWLPGDDHRILVAGGRIVAVARRMPAHVVGDGRHNIRTLLDRENADPRRSKSYRTLLMTIEFDSKSEQLLAARGYDLYTVPPAGDIVLLKSAANWTAGGTTFDLTDRIHPENARMAIRATELIGLDIAGVDLLIPDIGRSFREVGGGICEVNFRPGILVHISAEGAADRDVAGDLIDAIYRDPRQGSIPTLVVCAETGGDALCGNIAKALRHTWGLRTACHTGRGLWLDDWPVSDGPPALRDAHELAVRDPTIDAAVLAATPQQILEQGLGLSQADIVVLPQGDGVAPSERPRAEAIFRRAGAVVTEDADPDRCARALAACCADGTGDADAADGRAAM